MEPELVILQTGNTINLMRGLLRFVASSVAKRLVGEICL